MRRVSLIDADSIVYILAYNHKDSPEEIITTTCSSFLRDVLKATKATHYLGTFSASVSFRDAIYKVDKYKGNRPEKPEWIVRLGPLIKEHFIQKHGFINPDLGLEADDIVKGVSEYLSDEFVICSPDKDLKQIPGDHFDYRTPDLGIVTVSEDEASYNFWTQMLVGDSTDNITGIPGVGEKKAQLFLKESTSDIDRMFNVKSAFLKYYGLYYGEVIYKETYDTLLLLGKGHRQTTTLQDYTFRELAETKLVPVQDDSDL